MSSGGIAFHLLADIYPDLLDWIFNEARLKIMEVRARRSVDLAGCLSMSHTDD